MSDETTAAPSAPSGQESISIEQATSLLQAAPVEAAPEEKKGAAQVVDKAEAEEAAPETDSGTEQATEESAEGTGADEQETEASEEEQPAAPTIKPPASWAKDAQEAFAKLPPELQEVVSAREKEREAFANTKAQEAAQARKEREELLTYATQEVTQTLRMAQDAIEGEFAGIDWLALQASDPNTFLQLDALRRQRLEKIQGLQQQRDTLAKEQDAVRVAQARATLQQEAEKVKPVLQGLMGETFSEKTFPGEITKYLVAQGVPEAVLGNMSTGWELTISTKAMLYDKMQQAKAQATKKVASAPQVQKSGAKHMVADSGRAQKAKSAYARLEKTGSIEDAVAAMRSARGLR
jgi:hypothetical protein